MFKENIQQKIAVEVIKTLIIRFESFPEDSSDNRNAPFHKCFLNAFSNKLLDKVQDVPFLISLSGWLHGLNTTLGQQFFEKVAHILSDGEKKEYTSKRLGNLKITNAQKDYINEIMTRLSNNGNPNLLEENKKIFKHYDSVLVNALDFSADVFIEDDDSVIAIELKSVRPNSGEMRGEKQKILEGKAALFREFSNKTINFYIGFPFDPTSKKDTGYDKTRFLNSIINMTKFFDPNETLIAGELWDLLSGEAETMEQILAIINDIAKPEFINNFSYLCKNENRSNPEYKEILRKWHIYSEIELLDRDDTLKEKIKDNKKLMRIYNKRIFTIEGNYDLDRHYELKNIL
jgi:hypothetical protein